MGLYWSGQWSTPKPSFAMLPFFIFLLALSVVLLSSLPGARLSLQQLLFGDILGIAWADLLPLTLLLVGI